MLRLTVCQSMIIDPVVGGWGGSSMAVAFGRTKRSHSLHEPETRRKRTWPGSHNSLGGTQSPHDFPLGSTCSQWKHLDDKPLTHTWPWGHQTPKVEQQRKKLGSLCQRETGVCLNQDGWRRVHKEAGRMAWRRRWRRDSAQRCKGCWEAAQ